MRRISEAATVTGDVTPCSTTSCSRTASQLHCVMLDRFATLRYSSVVAVGRQGQVLQPTVSCVEAIKVVKMIRESVPPLKSPPTACLGESREK